MNNLNELIEQYFTKDNIIDMLTQYELYYQISLSSYVYETLQDIEETNTKMDELALRVDPNIAISNIFDILLHSSQEENFEDKFYYHLRTRALMHALKDFVNKDAELLGKEKYIEQKSDMILKDTFFDEDMKLQFESDYPIISEDYEMMVTDDLVDKIHHNFSLQQ